MGDDWPTLALKILIYGITIAAALFFAFWEGRLKRQLTDGALMSSPNPSDWSPMNDLSERMQRERTLKSLPREMTSKLRLIIGLKFLFVAILIVEVIFLQRPT